MGSDDHGIPTSNQVAGHRSQALVTTPETSTQGCAIYHGKTIASLENWQLRINICRCVLQIDMKQQRSSVQRLIELNVRRFSDIRRARATAERLATPESSTRFRRAEKLLAAVGDANRMKILLLLSKREMCVCELESALSLPQPTVSHHLGVLERADLLHRNKRGKFVFYEVVHSQVLDLVRNRAS